jgi:hypothetical protein
VRAPSLSLRRRHRDVEQLQVEIDQQLQSCLAVAGQVQVGIDMSGHEIALSG